MTDCCFFICRWAMRRRYYSATWITFPIPPAAHVQVAAQLWNVRRQKYSLLPGGQQTSLFLQPETMQPTASQWIWILRSPHLGGSDGAVPKMCVCGKVQSAPVYSGHSLWRIAPVSTNICLLFRLFQGFCVCVLFKVFVARQNSRCWVLRCL